VLKLIAMRKRFEQQLSLGVIPINEVKFDNRSRDELPEILKGLQHIFVDSDLSEAIFSLLDTEINSGKQATGRPGMTLWEILVLGSVRLALNIDYDRLHDLCNNHKKLRAILGVSTSCFTEEKEYALNTIKDNVRLLSCDLIDSINLEVVKAGHRIVKKNEVQNGKATDKLSLMVRGDSYVLESNIHFPVDIWQLWDSARKVLDCLLQLGTGLTGHRQLVWLKNEIRSCYLLSKEIHRKKGGNYQPRLTKSVKHYLSRVTSLLEKSELSYASLSSSVELGCYATDSRILKLIKELGHYIGYLQKMIDLVDRRILQGETIPHSEKILSIFEPEVEWISKGKSGKSVEFGHRHLIYTDQYQFILHHKVMVGQTDQEVALFEGKEVALKYDNSSYDLASLSYDRGFFSTLSKQGLQEFYGLVVMPKPGKKSLSQQAEEEAESFTKKRHHHSGVEGNINSLEHTGLDKCPDRGLESFKKYASLGVLAYNLRQLGKWIKKVEQASDSNRRSSRRQMSKAA